MQAWLLFSATNAINPFLLKSMGRKSIKFLGNGGRHKTKYDSLKETSKFDNSDAFVSEESSYAGFPLDGKYFPYSVSLYPSSHMQNTYKTSTPIIFSVASFIILRFVAKFFLLYDYLVEYENREVLNAGEFK
jgi:hypothetical protein